MIMFVPRFSNNIFLNYFSFTGVSGVSIHNNILTVTEEGLQELDKDEMQKKIDMLLFMKLKPRG